MKLTHSLWGIVHDQDGTVLGTGQLLGLPMLLPNNVATPVQVSIQSQFTLTELFHMGIVSVALKVHAQGYFHILWFWWPGSDDEEITYTVQQLTDLARSAGLI